VNRPWPDADARGPMAASRFLGPLVLGVIGLAILVTPVLILKVPAPRSARVRPSATQRSTVATTSRAAPIARSQPAPPTTQPVDSAPPSGPGALANGASSPEFPPLRILDDILTPTSRRADAAVNNDSRAIRESRQAPATQPLDRSAARRQARVNRLGGTIDTENAVEAGLIWLAAHQDADGHWDRVTYRTHCPDGSECPGPGLYRNNSDLDAGVTALCLLAFLGAGYTDGTGPHQLTVRKAVAALLRMQQPDGGFSPDPTMAGYNNSIATLALSEYYALSGERLVVEPLERAVERLVLSQQPLGGWDYLPRSNSGRNDTSITGWAVQALQASAAAGIPVPRRALIKAAFHVARATADDGRVWYADAGVGFKLDDQNNEPSHRFGPAMTAVGLMTRQLLGWRPDEDMLRKQQALLLGEPPSVATMQRGDRTELHDYYYWYYGTLGAFKAGDEVWQRWNNALRDALLPLQDRFKSDSGKRKHTFGSFPPYGQGWGKWGRSGGRVYATAINVLTLEIYYRHSPAYLEEPAVVTAADWREFLHGADTRTIDQAIDILGDLRLEIGEPVLVELIGLKESRLAVDAALALVQIGSPIGRGILESARDSADTRLRDRVLRALQRVAAFPAAPARGRVRMVDAANRLATLDLSPAWVGMSLHSEGDAAARLRVIQRFTDNPIVVAEVLDRVDTLRSGAGVISDNN
jgi:hypothetical protein